MHPRFGTKSRDPVNDKRKLTLRPDRDRPWVTATAHATFDGLLYVPRYFYGDTAAAEKAVTARSSVELKPELGQVAGYEAVVASWKRCGGAVLCLPTGHGKTVVAIKLIEDLGCKALVVCHKAFLLDQWAERLGAFGKSRVTVVRGGKCDLSGDVVLATVQTLVSRGYHHTEDFDAFGLLVFDECHHVAAEVFGKIMFGCSFARTLGLSATPERRDGLSQVIEWFLGPVCYKGESRREPPEVVKATFSHASYALAPPTNPKTNQVCYASLLNVLAENPDRTRFVAGLVAAELAQHPQRRVLVLSHRRTLCERLGELLAEFQPFVYLGGGKGAYRPARVVLASWNLVSEGFDDPGLDTVVLATPATDVVQAIGRVGRSGRRGKVLDVVDAWGPCFAQHAKRRRAYSTTTAKTTSSFAFVD